MVGGAAVPLSGRTQAGTSQLDYGAMVAANVTTATLCVRLVEAGQRVTVTSADTRVPSPAPAKAEVCTCRKVPALRSTSACAEDERLLQAWELQLQAGQNLVNITSGSPTAAGQGVRHTLAVVRLAPPEHAELQSLQVKGLDGSDIVLCGPPLLSVPGSERAATAMSTKARPDLGSSEPPSSRQPGSKGGGEPVRQLDSVPELKWKACKPGEQPVVVALFAP